MATPQTSENVAPSSHDLINKNSREPAATHALSSVLLVQDSCLSSDDFHEALFLDKKSPNKTFSKKKRRSKKRDPSSTAAATNLNPPFSRQAPTSTGGSNVREITSSEKKQEDGKVE